MRFSMIPLLLALASVQGIAPAQAGTAQTQAPPARIVGSVMAVNGDSVTVKSDSGAAVTFTVASDARILETQPGAKTLAGANPIQLSNIAVGDRVLVVIHPSADGSSTLATTLIAMKQSDLAQHQAAEQADWQRRGVGGLVKTVDAAAGTITIASGPRILTIHVTPKTTIRRYSPDSVKFSDAQPSTIAQIQPGDQLRAKGDRSADAIEVTAEEVIFGSFRNIAGTVVSADVSAGTVTVTDLATKKPVIIHITAESQMHKLPEQMAQFLAMRLKRGSGPDRNQSQPTGRPADDAVAGSSDHSAWRQAGTSGSAGGGQRGGDLSQILQRTPAVQLADLHKGDAVMIVASQGSNGSATAVTLLAGVEPLLTASPSASESVFSASWNLGGGGAGGMGDEGTP